MNCLKEGAVVVATEIERGKRKKEKKKRGIGRTILMTLGFLLLFAVTVVLTLCFLTIRPPDVSGDVPSSGENDTQVEERTAGRYSVLVVGTDDAGLNTDTILVASLDSKNNIASVMSIPRDTMSNVTRNVKKINAAYASGAKDGVGNIDNLKKEISYLMGFPVDNYVVIDLTAFEELIDELGGVTIDVPRNMHYDDPYQDLHIHIEKGLQTLNGKDAIGFVRYRSGYAEGDLGRVKAQQLFIQALAEQVANPATITKLPQLTEIILDNMRTDLTYGELVWFVKEAVSVDMTTNLHMFTLPGVAETVKPTGSYQALSYYLPYEDEILELVNQYFNPYSNDLVDLNIVDTDALLRQAGIQRAEKQEQKEAEADKETDANGEGDESTGKVEENDNPSESNTDADKNADDTTGSVETDKTVESDEIDEPAVNEENLPNADNTEQPGEHPDEGNVDYSQPPDEVLKHEAEQNNTPVEPTVPEVEDNEGQNDSIEDVPAAETNDTAGQIPGEVLKTDMQ